MTGADDLAAALRDQLAAGALVIIVPPGAQVITPGPAAPAAETPKPDTRKLVYSVAEAAEALGVSKSSLYDLMRSGQLGSVDLGRRRVIPAAALAELLARRTRPQDHA